MSSTRLQGILFVGIDGPKDLLATILVADLMRKAGYSWEYADAATVLSPFTGVDIFPSEHMGVGEFTRRTSISSLNRLHLQTRAHPCMPIAQFLRSKKVFKGIDRVLGLDIQDGTLGLTETFIELQKPSTFEHGRRHYETIIFVSLGGGCLWSGPADGDIRRPLYGSVVLSAARNAGIQGKLVVVGPGTDGELSEDVLSTHLQAASPVVLPAENLHRWAEVVYRRSLSAHIKIPEVRTLYESYSGQKDAKIFELRPDLPGVTGIISPYHHRVSRKLVRRIYFYDLLPLQSPFFVECETVYEWFGYTQMLQTRTGFEGDLEFTQHKHRLMRFLTPPHQLQEEDRRHLLEQGLRELEEYASDGAWVFTPDWERVSSRWHNHDLFDVQSNSHIVRIMMP